MPSSEVAAGEPLDDAEPSSATPTRHHQQKPVFDLNAFLGREGPTANDDNLDRSRWRRMVAHPSVRKVLGEFGVGLTIGVLKGMASASLMLFIVVFLVFGPNAPWNQLKWNILRGGADDASAAKCNEIGEWFSLFDQQTNRIYSLVQEAGSPDTWDTVTTTKLSRLVPIYMDDWLAEMKNHQPPPEGKQLNDTFITFLENYEAYVVAIQDGDVQAQKYYERENSLLLNGIDIEVRYITNLCV